MKEYIRELEKKIKLIQSSIDEKEERLKENLDLTIDDELIFSSEIIDQQIYKKGLQDALDLTKNFNVKKKKTICK